MYFMYMGELSLPGYSFAFGATSGSYAASAKVLSGTGTEVSSDRFRDTDMS